jgi:hypothetical protein
MAQLDIWYPLLQGTEHNSISTTKPSRTDTLKPSKTLTHILSYDVTLAKGINGQTRPYQQLTGQALAPLAIAAMLNTTLWCQTV